MTRLYIITLFILLIYRIHHAKYGLDESQSGIKTARSINRLGYEDDTTLVAEIEEELKNLLMKMKEESENAGLNLKLKQQQQQKKLRSWILVPCLHGKYMGIQWKQ